MNAFHSIVALGVLLVSSSALASHSHLEKASIEESPGLYASATRQEPDAAMVAARTESDAMLRCARMRDVAAQLRCFDEVKRSEGRTHLRNDTRVDPPHHIGPGNENREPVRSSAGDESRHLDRYAQEIARQLGKEMSQDDYPRRARDEGRGGTTELLLRVDSNATLTQISVSRSSGYTDLDQFAVNKVANLRLPKVPKTIRSPVFTVHLPITFAIRAAAH